MKVVVISALLMMGGPTAWAQSEANGRSFRFPDAGSIGERRLPDSGQRLRLRGGREINAGYVQVRNPSSTVKLLVYRVTHLDGYNLRLT